MPSTTSRLCTALAVLVLWAPAAPYAQVAPAGDPAYRAGGIILSGPSGNMPVVSPTPSSMGRQLAMLQVPELQLTTQVAFGRPVDNVTIFKPDQPAISAWFRYNGGQPGAALIGRVVFLAPAEEIEAVRVTAQLEKPEDAGHFKFTAPADGWPEGRYRLDLISDSAVVRAQEFQVRRSR